MNGEGGINNGFQFRSRWLPDHDVCGYQMDNNLQTPWLARLYDEYGRHTLAWWREWHCLLFKHGGFTAALGDDFVNKSSLTQGQLGRINASKQKGILS